MGDVRAFSKQAHAKGCDGQLVRQRFTVTMDRNGRLGNGGWVAHDYRCNKAWTGCRARVLVAEYEVRELALTVEVRR